MDQQNEALEKGNIKRLFLQYALPAIIATTATSFYNIIDRIFIGQGVGALAISGLALTFPIMNLGTALGTLVGAGSSTIISIRMGEKRQQEAIQTLGNAFILNLLIGLTFSVLALCFLNPLLYLFGASDATLPFARDFMRVILLGNVITHLFFGLNNIIRASGYPTKAMISLLLTIGVNIILAPLFIFVFHWGIMGAATATVISQSVGLVWVLSHFLSSKPYVHFTRQCFRLSASIIGHIFSIGVAPFFIHCCSCLIAILMNWQLGQYGGDLAIGAFGIINSIISLLIMIMFGFTMGMQPIVGYNWGAKQYSRAIEAFRLTVYYATAVALIGFLAAELFPQFIARWFTTDSQLIALTVKGLRIYVLCLAVVGFQVVTTNFFQSIGRAGISIFLSLTRQLLFLAPLLLILPPLFGLEGVWFATPIADLISALVTAAVLWYYWKRL
jgi:putative MATE family efflux protein